MGNCAPKKNKNKVPKIEREKLRPNPLQIPTKLHQVPDSPSPRHLHFDLLTPRERSRGRSLPVSPKRTSEIIHLSRQLSLRHHSISKNELKVNDKYKDTDLHPCLFCLCLCLYPQKNMYLYQDLQKSVHRHSSQNHYKCLE
jgi:hypothetical protein